MKKIMRQEILAKRTAQSEAEVAQKSESIQKQVFKLDAYKKAEVIMVYLDFRKEVKTETIITKALSEGKKVIIPVCEKENTQLIPSEIKDYPGDLEPGTWGILEPKPGCLRPIDPSKIDLVLIPGVAFDEQGNRLGYGAGYYDRFLVKVPKASNLIALAFELQIVEDAQPADHDIPVDMIITEKRIIIPI